MAIISGGILMGAMSDGTLINSTSNTIRMCTTFNDILIGTISDAGGDTGTDTYTGSVRCAYINYRVPEGEGTNCTTNKIRTSTLGCVITEYET